MPIDPAFAIDAVRGSEWSIPPVETPETAPSTSFGSMLTESLEALNQTQVDAAQAAQALASGQASDPTAVVMAVERAQLAMQLASQVRTKAVEAAQTIFQTQV